MTILRLPIREYGIALYLLVLRFLSSEFCTFPYIDFVDILLHLHLSILFWGDTNINCIILNLKFLLFILYIYLCIDFYTLTYSLQPYCNCLLVPGFILFFLFFQIFCVNSYLICIQRFNVFFSCQSITFNFLFMFYHSIILQFQYSVQKEW